MTPQLHDKIVTLVPRMEGWCTPDKALDMAQLVITERPNLVVELGVFGGRSLVPQALGLQATGKGMIFGIDAWSNQVALENFDADIPENSEHIKYWTKMNMPAILGGAMRAVDEHWLTDFVCLIRGRSELCVERFADASIDILHIDGDHMEISSCRDVALWLPKMKSGGHIWFDDTDWLSTQKALRLLEKSASVISDKVKYRLYRKHEQSGFIVLD